MICNGHVQTDVANNSICSVQIQKLKTQSHQTIQLNHHHSFVHVSRDQDLFRCRFPAFRMVREPWPLAVWSLHDNGDVVSHNAAIAACGKAQWSTALYLWDICGARIQPNVRTYGAMASACRQWTMAIFLLQDMGQKAVPPNLVIFNTCARGSRSEGVWIQAMELLKATAVDHQPDVISFTLGVGACEQTACWEGAMDLLYQGMLSTRQLEPDMMLCGTAMSVCETAGQWEEVLQLLHAFKDSLPSTVSFNVAISACEKVQSWVVPLKLLEFMRCNLAKPDVYTFNSSINACGKGKSWTDAMELLGVGVNGKLRSDVVTYSSLVHADDWPISMQVLSMAQEWVTK